VIDLTNYHSALLSSWAIESVCQKIMILLFLIFLLALLLLGRLHDIERGGGSVLYAPSIDSEGDIGVLLIEHSTGSNLL